MRASILPAAAVLLVAAASARAADPPNVVYILVDDLGIGDVRAFNPDGKIPTPHIDRLAQEGMRFTDAHTNSSVCTPTRYGVLTGRYAWRTRLKQGVLWGHDGLLIDPQRLTVAGLLRGHGYQTACFGKWHLGMDWTPRQSTNRPAGKLRPRDYDCSEPVLRGPLDVGFDDFFGLTGSLNMSPHAYVDGRHLQGTLELVDSIEDLDARGFVQPSKPGLVAKEYLQDQVLKTLSSRACAWLRQHADGPFFLYLPLPSPHAPIVPRRGFVGSSGMGLYGDFCAETDWVVGQVLDTLDAIGASENTLVLFASDNGASPQAKFAALQAQGHFPSGPYRGLKGTLWEGGHRTPLVARWPGRVAAGSTSGQLVCTTDLLATCSDLLGVSLPPDAGEDSVSMLPALEGKPIPGVAERAVVHHSDSGVFAVRRGRWKLLLDNRGGSRRVNPKDPPIADPAEYLLFDMQADAGETTNVSGEHPGVVDELMTSLADLITRGRSTPGPDQPTDLTEAAGRWRQLNPVREKLDRGAGRRGS